MLLFFIISLCINNSQSIIEKNTVIHSISSNIIFQAELEYENAGSKREAV